LNLKYFCKDGANRTQNSLLFAEMQPILATSVANLARIAELLLSLQSILTKVESEVLGRFGAIP
jgi:CRISPR/Cas system-associated endoribonuclease Cas2